VSSLWTPDGERPVARPSSPPAGPPPDAFAQGDEVVDDDALAAQVEAMRAELANSPVEVVVANHCYGLFELAAVYLSQQPPLLDQARLAIDALGCLVDGLEGRLGEAEPALKEGVTNLRLAYVQIDGALRSGADVEAVVGVDAAGGEVGVDGVDGVDGTGATGDDGDG
jgi:hypothetical protein